MGPIVSKYAFPRKALDQQSNCTDVKGLARAFYLCMESPIIFSGS